MRLIGALVPGYVKALSWLLLLQGALGSVYKMGQGRSDDLVHNGLHLLSGALGLYLVRGQSVRFALGFGLFYTLLGALGPILPNPLGLLPLGSADHLFHVIVGGATLAVGLSGLLIRRRHPTGV